MEAAQPVLAQKPRQNGRSASRIPTDRPRKGRQPESTPCIMAQPQISSSTSQVDMAHANLLQSIVNAVATIWRLTTAVPFFFLRTTWSIVSWVTVGMAANFANTASWVAKLFSEAISRFSNLSFSLLLKSLRAVNDKMDGLVENTPRLVKKALRQARAEKRQEEEEDKHQLEPSAHEAAHEKETHEGRQLRTAERPASRTTEDQPSRATTADLHLAPEESDVARAANDALHRLFDKAEGSRDTLLAEARKLAWHVWMLVALQVTALRSLINVTEGVVTWVLSTWLQLSWAAVILGVMVVAAPLAAGATALAWTVYFLLQQALWVAQLLDVVRGYVAPSMHSTMLGVRDTLQPYLAAKQMPPGEIQGALQSYYADGAALMREWLDAGERFTHNMLPDTAKPKREPTAQEEVGEAPKGAEAVLSDACKDAEDASHKAYEMASAASCTVLDVARVLLLGLATRFDLPMLRWVPGMYSGGGYGSQDPDVTHFLEVAGKGQE